MAAFISVTIISYAFNIASLELIESSYYLASKKKNKYLTTHSSFCRVIYFFKPLTLEYEFQNDIQAPLNRQIVKSSETIMYFVEMMDKMLTTFMGPHHGNDNDIGSTDNRPREYSSYYGNNYFDTAGQILNFAKTAYALFR